MNKKYNLKPGRHQFAPGAPAEHSNDNLTDEEAEWYLERYPHIAQLFVEKLRGCNVVTLNEIELQQDEHQIMSGIDGSKVNDQNQLSPKGKTTLQPSNIQTLQQTDEDLSTTN